LRSVSFHTLGCKVNAYETEVMKQLLLSAGYVLKPFEEAADVTVINTCSVTNIADRKSRQMIHRARKLNPDTVIVAAGCFVQAEADKLIREGCADIILGNEEKKNIVSVLEQWFGDPIHELKKEVGDISAVREYKNPPAGSMTDHTRAFLKIEDGCNAFCSYCIIPYVRGRVRSREEGDILEEAKKFASEGYRELVLTGINLSAYGTDFSGLRGNRDLPRLVGKLSDIPGIKRIRIGSLEPEIITEEFISALMQIPSFCPHFHLSLQSGCNDILKRMNRHYTTEEYLERIELIRRHRPDAAITTDVIVGFPGETEKEFETTKSFVKQVGFYEMHIFPYSRREGTGASSFPGQLTAGEKSLRAGMLSGIEKEMSHAYRMSKIGRQGEMLAEETIEILGEKYWVGSTKEYVRVAAPRIPNGQNRLFSGDITSFLTPEILLMGQIVNVS